MQSVSTMPRGQVTSGSALDADALVAALFGQEAQRLVSLARFFTDDRTAAEDLVQEAFIRLARSAHRIRDQEKAAAYLRSIVINLARDHNRRGLVSLRHRPPAVLDEPSAEQTASRRSHGVKSWTHCALCPTANVSASPCVTTWSCQSRRSLTPSGSRRTR